MIKLGKISLAGSAVLAPLAGYSDSPMRRISRAFGAGLVYTEMLKTAALVRKNPKTLDMAAFDPSERPIALQLAGREPEETARAARIAMEFEPDAIDFNAGCPVKKIIRERAGAALMQEPELVGRIMRALRKAVDCTLSIKIRLGWSGDETTGVQIARIAEAEGADFIAVHGRTAEQQFRGRCSLEGIAEIAEAVDVPVIGNGDVRSADDAEEMLRSTGCAAVMVGRGAVGNPWIFRDISNRLRGVEPEPGRTFEDLRLVMSRHMNHAVEKHGPVRAAKLMRKHVSAYLRATPECRASRRDAMRMKSSEEFEDLLDVFIKRWTSS